MPDSQLIDVLRRRWRVLLLAAFVAAVAGFAATSMAPKTYEARVDLLVGPVNSTAELDASGGLARTYADLATSEPVLRKAMQATGDERTVEDVKRKISTSSNAITRIVSVAVRDRDPRVAARLANNVGYRLRRLANTTPTRAIAALDAFSHEPELTPLSGDNRDAVMRAASRVFGASEAGRIGVVQAAAAPSRPAAPSVPLMTALAALAGLCLASFVVLAQEIRRRSRADEQRAAALGAPLSIIEGEGAVRPLAQIGSGADSAESYRALATRAQLLARTGGSTSLLVVDGRDGAAAATVASSLADAVAADGRDVILADLDLAAGGVTELLGLEGRLGHTNLVADDADLTDDRALRQALVQRGPRLSVLARGTAVPARRESADRLSALVGRLREQADVVILAGPALTRSSTLIAWARTVDQVCLVVDSQADDDEMQRVVVSLERLDGGFVGAVLRGRATTRRRRHGLRAS